MREFGENLSENIQEPLFNRGVEAAMTSCRLHYGRQIEELQAEVCSSKLAASRAVESCRDMEVHLRMLDRSH